MPTLTPDQIAAIVQYSAQVGRNWKSALLADWQRSAPLRFAGDFAPLRQLRNSHGPEWLARFQLATITAA